MSAHNTGPKRRRLPSVKVTTVGLALGAASAQPAWAEPVPTPLNAPKPGEPPAWTSAPTPFNGTPRPPEVAQAGGIAPPAMIAPIAAPALPTPPGVQLPAPLPPGDWPKLPAPQAPAFPQPDAPLAKPSEFVEPPPSAPLAPPSRPEKSLPSEPVGSNVSATTVPAAPPAPGDDAMRMNLTPLKSAIAGAALASAPLHAAAEDNKVPNLVTKSDKDDVAAIKANLDAALKRLAEAEVKINAQATKIDEQDRTILKLTTAVNGTDITTGLVKKFEELQTKFGELQSDYTKLAAKPPAGNDTSMSAKVPQPMAAAPVPAAGTAGTVRIVNKYGMPAKIVINGLSHTVEPNAEKVVIVAAPEFIYQLIGGTDAAPVHQPIQPGQTLNLTVNY